MGRRKKKNREEQKGAGWIASFADTMTLLLTFFILLYSMADVNEDKIKAMAQVFQEVLSGESADSILEFDEFDGTVPIIGGDGKVDGPDLPYENEEDYTYEELKEYISANSLEEQMTLEKNKDGILLELGESILFASGKSELKSKAILAKVAEVITNTTGEVRIEGHTDNVPISNPNKTNWELSTERSVAVVRYFMEEKKIDPKRLSAVGYGEYKPTEDNGTSEGRAANRRVSILFVAPEE
ncbi:OmpA family protein [uncultured Clostridium sp.]|uniref:OmpA family protein n=1 Tax=uncultured Clostridium sp. TaxID=59620 RepID=UPI00261055E5|nr:OmpA family protein [uncultured Clostridium sp.]